MELLVLLSLLGLFIHIMLPNTLAIIRGDASSQYFSSARDDTPQYSNVVKRAQRASNNYQVSLVAFLVLMWLTDRADIDVNTLATIWLALRLVYLPLYLVGVSHLRTLLWGGSVFVLFMMAWQLGY